MKTKRAPRPRAAAKAATVEEYLAAVPATTRPLFNELRATVRASLPKDAIEIISYGILAFRQKRVLVWIGAFADHCSLFPGASVIEKLRPELKAFTVSKGTVRFPAGLPLPLVLVKKLVKARVAEEQIRSR